MILMYHKVHPNSPTVWWVKVNDFYRQMSEISNRKVVYLSDYNPLDSDHVVITFDGIYKNILDFALPILQHFNYPFELFFTSDYLGKDNTFDNVEPNASFVKILELNELIKGGGRLQWHTKRHKNLKESQDIELIIDELTIPESIKELDRKGFNWFAYPHGEFNDLVVNEVKKRFEGAVSCNQGNDFDKFILNRVTVLNETSLRKNKIACIIASYNYGDYLIEAVESVLKQTILPNEILISDDFSSDDTQLIAENYVKRYPDLIKYNRNEKNLGVVNHFNKAVGLTKAEYIFFLGADNRLVSNYIEECSRILGSDNNIGVVYTDYAYFGSRARLKYESLSSSLKGRILNNVFFEVVFPEFSTSNKLKKALNKGNFIHGSSMFKRKAFLEVGGYKEEAYTPEDYNLFFEMIVKHDWLAKKVKTTNLEYRQHSISQLDNAVVLQKKIFLLKEENFKLIEKINKLEASFVHRLYINTGKVFFFFIKNYKRPIIILKRIIKIFKKNKF